MRTIEEIKADLKDCYSCESKACLFPETTHCGKPQDESVVTYEAEMGKALIDLFGLDRLEEICNAEREGRCVIMPCKVGDKIYTLSYKGIDKKTVVQLNIQFTDRIKHYSVITHNHRQACLCYENKDFGKTVFLTREAAKQAKEREQ